MAELRKQLRIVVTVALLAGVIGALLSRWDQLSGTPPERVIRVYRLHGCRCAFPWARSLEAEGFVVRLREYETLQYVRASLHMPDSLHGCHVGEYLGYFIEGHVSAAALRQLAAQRPDGRGLATQAVVNMEAEHASTVRDERSPVVLFDRQERERLWFKPKDPHQGDAQNDRRGA